MTNQHYARACAQGVSAPGHDDVANGFHVASVKVERKCPDMEIDQLVAIAPATETMRNATKCLDGPAFEAAQRQAHEKLEAACTKGETIRYDLVSLYHGGNYDLYTYRRYTDVRLAFIVEERAASFGDPDRADWRAAKGRRSMTTMLDFVSDVDAVGGNSGWPVVDPTGALGGLCFAINDAAESNIFANNPRAARSISVSWAAIETMLPEAYGAGALVE